MHTGGERRSPPRRELSLAVPEPPPFAIERSRLTTLLDVAAQQPLTVVVAPPGYGKTVLLSQWRRRHRGSSVRWLTLGPEHDDPLVLLDDLRAALGGRPGAVNAGGPQRQRKVRTSVRSRFVATLLCDLDRLPATTLVLDDLHQLSNPQVVDLVAELLAHAPRTLRVIAATRVDPPLSFFHLHDHRVLFQMRQEDLAFVGEEAAELVRRLSGVELSSPQLAALVERTEGWVAGLQLAAIALPGHDDVEDFVATFAGDDRAVADYLTERVLVGLPHDVREFLLSTCLLDRMSGPLCDFVTGRTDGHSMLDEIERRSLFVTPLDSERSWFRHHRLFLTYLRSHHRLSGSAPGSGTLARAAEWHRRHGELDTAVGYLVRAGCWDEVLEVASSTGAAMVQRGQASVVAAWIGSVPAAARRDRAGVELEAAAALVAAGELGAAQPLLDELAARAHPTQGDAAVCRLLRAWSALRVGALARAVQEADRTIEAVVASSAGDELPPAFRLVETRDEAAAAAAVVRGAALVQQGRFTEARDALGVHLDGLHAVWQLLALGSLALLEAWSERLDAAEQFALRALRLADELDMVWDPSAVLASLAMAVVERNRGHLEAARAALDVASAAITSEDDRLVAANLVDEHALLSLAEGDAAGCLTVLADQPPLGPASKAVALAGRRPAVEADAFLTIGDLERAARALSDASTEAPDVVRARVRLEIARGDVPAARKLVAEASAEPSLGHLLAQAVVEHLDGDEAAAAQHLDQVVRQAELDGNVGMFRWHEARSYVRSRYRSTPTAFLRSVVEQPVAATRPSTVSELVEQLTEREYFVLQLLPTRLTNAEIAQSLGISLNTVKTHLKHVYRKLDVEHRSDAVATAERLGLV